MSQPITWDVVNVAWLEHYITKVIPHVTCLIVSHDSSFLDNVCTDIIHYESRKLKYYHGNLSEFAKVKPEAKSYYTLAAATLRFNFPKPSFLDGVTSGEKPILSMKKVTFTYPGAPKPQLENITCSAVCLHASQSSVPTELASLRFIKLMTRRAQTRHRYRLQARQRAGGLCEPARAAPPGGPPGYDPQTNTSASATRKERTRRRSKR
ncbi:hypothetical protein Vretifemale_8277 [Volvox reticuliferus]|uniref:Elongation factor 3 n=1 Tax=Volvox reticuliferus TaxID=1737510 RepID=A0A8J4FLF3_9CHLO|nr:hypothetical protein Vretifemale_8277 [Volvox reticuliferus]